MWALTSMVALGGIIWSAVRALLKFVLTAAIGWLLARKGLLDSQGTRTLSQCVINVFIPALMFSKVVEGVDQDKLVQVGILALTSVLYMLMGLLFGLIVRLCTRVPRCWQNGVLATGAFSNWGDLPLVLIGTIAAVPPFDGTSDQALGLAYVSIFIFLQSTVVFVFGGTWLVSSDFDRSQADLDKPVRGLVDRVRDFTSSKDETSVRVGESLGRVRSNSMSSVQLEPVVSGVINPADQFSSLQRADVLPSRPPLSSDRSLSLRLRAAIRPAVERLIAPPSAAIIVGFVVAIVPQIKALFVSVPSQHLPNGPDGKPPLDFLLDIANFIGGASVPTSLLILGYSLSRLSLRHPPAITSAALMCLLKMFVGPVVAVAWMQFVALHTGWIAESDRILRLSLVLPAACPTATTMLYLTQVFSTDERELELQCVSFFLVLQYAVIGLTMTITVSYTLHLIA
ncbi:Protein M3 [Savitreella phatthalungensis]